MKYNRVNFFNLTWGVLAKLFSGMKLAFLGIIIARYLGPEDFGVFSYVISFVSLFSVLAEFRLQSILVRDFSENKIDPKILLGSSLKICLFFASIGYLSLSLIVYILDDNNIHFTQINNSYMEKTSVPCFQINGLIIWGATAMILSEIKEALKNIKP